MRLSATILSESYKHARKTPWAAPSWAARRPGRFPEPGRLGAHPGAPAPGRVRRRCGAGGGPRTANGDQAIGRVPEGDQGPPAGRRRRGCARRRRPGTAADADIGIAAAGFDALVAVRGRQRRPGTATAGFDGAVALVALWRWWRSADGQRRPGTATARHGPDSSSADRHGRVRCARRARRGRVPEGDQGPPRPGSTALWRWWRSAAGNQGPPREPYPPPPLL